MNRKSTDMLIALLVICVLALGGLLAVKYAGGELIDMASERMAAFQRKAELPPAMPAEESPPMQLPPPGPQPRDDWPPLQMPPFEKVAPPRDTSPLPSLPPGATPALPATPIQTWVDGARDYPARALREGLTGQVTARWTVHSDGHVSNCRVVSSSGHASLDAGTCALMMERARYVPAMNASGQPIDSQVQLKWRWELAD